MSKLTDKNPLNAPIEVYMFLSWITQLAIFLAIMKAISGG